MIEPETPNRDFLRLVRQKYSNINNRVRNRKSYVAKNIKNLFSWPQFLAFCLLHNLRVGQHCHRPNKDGDYSPDNLVFISAKEHARISGMERRKLTQNQIQEVRDLSRNMSLRKIAKRFSVSHVTIYRYLKMEDERITKE